MDNNDNESNKSNRDQIIIDKKDIESLITRSFLFVGAGVLIGTAMGSIGGGVFPSMFLPMMGLIIALKPWVKIIRKKEYQEGNKREAL